LLATAVVRDPPFGAPLSCGLRGAWAAHNRVIWCRCAKGPSWRRDLALTASFAWPLRSDGYAPASTRW